MTTITELKASIEAKKFEIQTKNREIRNFSYESTQEEYDEFLNDCYGEVVICGSTFSPAYALRLLDETAYNTGKNDYDDSMDLDSVTEYQELTNELEDLESELEDLETDLELEEEKEQALEDNLKDICG